MRLRWREVGGAVAVYVRLFCYVLGVAAIAVGIGTVTIVCVAIAEDEVLEAAALPWLVVGALSAVFGACMLIVGLLHRLQWVRMFSDE